MRKELRKKEYTDKIIDIHTHIAYRQIYSQTFLDEVTKEFLEKGLSKKKLILYSIRYYQILMETD